MERRPRGRHSQRITAAPFVGRAEELGALKAALEDALDEKGSLWMLAGEPGIGKTRLAQELAVHARRQGAKVVVGHCTEEEGAPPYLPFVQILSPTIREEKTEVLRELLTEDASLLAKLLPQVAVRLPDLRAGPQLSPESERYLLLEAVARLLRNLARECGLVLVLDDLHWADKPSLLLLQHLARQLQGSKLLMVGVFRDLEIDAGHPLSMILANLRRDGVYQRIALSGLAVDQAHDVIAAFAEREAPDTFVRALHRQTDGNPFFIEEILRHLIQQGVIDPDEAGWTDVNLDEISLPEGVKGIIGRRLSGLSEECHTLLRQAAVVGRQFRHDLLIQVSGKADDEMLDLTDEALRNVVIEDAPGREAAYSFTHALTRQTLLEELSHAWRQRLHRRVAEAMERLYSPNPEPHLSELAHHFCEAAPLGMADKAIAYAKRAGEKAAAALGYEEAARLYEMALETLDLSEGQDEDLRCELLLALGDAQMSSGQVDSAREVFAKAADCARALGAPGQLARAALGFGGRWIYGGDVLVELLEEALSALGGGDPNLRVRVLTRLVWELGAQGLGYDPEAHERRLALSREALAAARRLDDPATLAHALRARHDALWGPETTDERLVLATEAVRLAEDSGLKDVELEARLARIGNLMELGEVDEANREMELYAGRAEGLQQPIYLFHALVIRTKLAIHRGEMQRAERLSGEALAMGQRAGYPVVRTHGVQMFALRREQGRLQELETAARGIVDLYPTVPGFAASMAALYMEMERDLDARSVFERLAVDDFAAIPRDWFWLISMNLLSQVCSYLKDTRRAAVLYQLLLPFAQRNVCVVSILSTGSASRSLGLLAATMSRGDDAERHFEDAIRMNARMGARPALAWTQHDYARMLVARRHHGDRKNAYLLLTQALGTARELGLTRLEECVICLLESRRSLTPVYPDGLTRREVDVLRLIAAGHSNSDISEELVLSIRTVERHITNVYTKINARGRADATAYALSHGLARHPRTPV